jgi:hypothetical protein
VGPHPRRRPSSEQLTQWAGEGLGGLLPRPRRSIPPSPSDAPLRPPSPAGDARAAPGATQASTTSPLPLHPPGDARAAPPRAPRRSRTATARSAAASRAAARARRLRPARSVRVCARTHRAPWHRTYRARCAPAASDALLRAPHTRSLRQGKRAPRGCACVRAWLAMARMP